MVNGAVVDHWPEVADDLAPADRAEVWASKSGFKERYPNATLRVDETSGFTTVVFTEGANARAALAFRHFDGGWLLDSLSYC